jgi:peptidyl-prolyl cis-trans isomerase B (cyclophilin B)
VTSKREREREYERRRYEKWQQRQAEAHAKQRRQRVIAGSVAGVIVLGLAVVGIVAAASDGSGSASPTATSTTTATPGASPSPSLSAPDPSVAQDRTWTGDIAFNSGTVGISLDGHLAPHAVANFTTLAAAGFFDDTKCHRLTTSGIYVLQCGDPTATGNGGPGYTWGPVENAPADNVYPAGTIAMARSGDDGNSMGSQFFIVYKDSTIPPDSAGGYTVFGKVTTGLPVIQAIADAGTASDGVAPLHDVIIQKVETQ